MELVPVLLPSNFLLGFVYLFDLVMATLRIKTAGGQHILHKIDLQTSLSELKVSISEVTKIPHDMLKLRLVSVFFLLLIMYVRVVIVL